MQHPKLEAGLLTSSNSFCAGLSFWRCTYTVLVTPPFRQFGGAAGRKRACRHLKSGGLTC